MGTVRIGKQSNQHLYIKEWLEHLELSDEKVANRFDPPISRSTVWRWQVEQWRLRPEKVHALAKAMGLNDGRDLYRPPPRRSIDAVLDKVTDDNIYEATLEFVERLTKKSA